MLEIIAADTDDKIKQCADVFLALRPHLTAETFLSQVKRQQEQGYCILMAALDGDVVSVIGFRFAEFLAWGKVLYIDDLATLLRARGNGCASKLLDEVIELAKRENCAAVHLDTGFGRSTAHRLYLNKGFQISSHHLSYSF